MPTPVMEEKYLNPYTELFFLARLVSDPTTHSLTPTLHLLPHPESKIKPRNTCKTREKSQNTFKGAHCGTVEPCVLWGLQAHRFESCPRSECRLGFLTQGNGFLAAMYRHRDGSEISSSRSKRSPVQKIKNSFERLCYFE
ncbi:hypothetical protein E2C01_028063 [Portunus trituberculatus]|uniref:Uncharacterized protein n=1 Tax=Portunus trituberculatus TaxID=210409 RepID=A0A5B7EN22_PORTR|nr:hypothetical protein [Portunus trituberculatus]